MKSEKWLAVYVDEPLAVIPGWQIKTDDKVNVPIAIVPEPLGGPKIGGRSAHQAKNACLIAAAPELLRALRALVNNKAVSGLSAHIRDDARWRGKPDDFVRALSVIAKAEGKFL